MILAVDDDPDLLAGLRRALATTGVPVITAETPSAALAILADRPVDLLISDIDMPVMDGLELVRQVRVLHPDVIRVLLTGHATYDAARRAINEGEVHRFLAKPFDPAELRRVVGEALARRAELARRSRSGVAAEQRRALLAQLEAEHPGITALPRDPRGAYMVSCVRAGAAERALTASRWATATRPPSA